MMNIVGDYVLSKRTGSTLEEEMLMQLGLVLSEYDSLNSMHNVIVEWYKSQVSNRILTEKYLDFNDINRRLLHLKIADDKLICEYYAWLN